MNRKTIPVAIAATLALTLTGCADTPDDCDINAAPAALVLSAPDGKGGGGGRSSGSRSSKSSGGKSKTKTKPHIGGHYGTDYDDCEDDD